MIRCWDVSHIDHSYHRKKLMIVRLDCICKRVSSASKRNFTVPSIQQVGMHVQQAHGTKHVKDTKYSASKKHTKQYNISHDATSCNPQRNKVYTPRPACKDGACTFNFTIFCNKSDENWYLTYSSGRNTCCPYHNAHLPISMEYMSVSLRHLPPTINTLIVHLLKEYVNPILLPGWYHSIMEK